MSAKDQRDQEFINEREHQLPPSDEMSSPDMRAGARAIDAFNRSPVGEPPMDYTVRSVFDSRPVQGTDFNISGTTTDTNQITNGLITFVVPTGYVAVLRTIHVWIDVPLILASRSDVLMSIFKNGGKVQFNSDIIVGDESTIECFVIADQNETIGISMDTADFQQGEPLVTVTVSANLYGNMLVKTGSAAPFEIANKVGEGKVATIGPPQGALPAIAHDFPMTETPVIAAAIAAPKVDLCSGLTPQGQRSMSRDQLIAWQNAWQHSTLEERNLAIARCGPKIPGGFLRRPAGVRG